MRILPRNQFQNIQQLYEFIGYNRDAIFDTLYSNKDLAKLFEAEWGYGEEVRKIFIDLWLSEPIILWDNSIEISTPCKTDNDEVFNVQIVFSIEPIVSESCKIEFKQKIFYCYLP